MLNFNQLRAFYHAGKSQHFTQAAKELFISQPAVTAQIKSLENMFNLTLFRRKGRKLYLTSEGRILFEQVSKIFEYEKTIEKTIKDMRNLSVGMLRIGTTKTYARHLMPSLLSYFFKVHPEIKITVNEGSAQEMILDLLEFRNDVAVMSKVIAREELTFTPFRREPIVLILSPAHRLAASGWITFEQLANEPIIMKEPGSGTRKEVEALFETHGRVPHILMESGNIELIKQLAMQGKGLSFLVNSAVAEEISAGKLAKLQLKGFEVSLDVNIAYLKNQHLSLPARAFVEMLEQFRANDRTPGDVGGPAGRLLSPM